MFRLFTRSICCILFSFIAPVSANAQTVLELLGNFEEIPAERTAGNDVINKDVARLMVTDPTAAETIFRQHGTFSNQMYLSLLLGTIFSDRPGAPEEIRKILDGLADKVRSAGKGQGFYEFFTRVIAEPEPYNGNLTEWLRYLSVANDGRIALLPDPLFVPCEFIIEHKKLRYISNGEMGSSMDNYFPQNDCNKYHALLPKSFFAYSKLLRSFDGAFGAEGPGSINDYYARQDSLRLDDIALFPEELRPSAQERAMDVKVIDNPFCDIPLAKWSLVGLSNWIKHQTIISLYVSAEKDLADYYTKSLNKDVETSHFLAKMALNSEAGPAEGYWSGMKCPVDSLRYAILSDVPSKEIFDGLASKRFDAHEWADGYPGYKEYYYQPGIDSYPGQPEPILHFAVLRPDVLKRLIDEGVSVNAANRFGKTPLMTAAQYDQLESVEILLQAGADVNAATNDLSPLTFGKRTPLMYAAANASLPVIRALLQAGANVQTTDNRSNIAREYLIGVSTVLQCWRIDHATDCTVNVPGNSKLANSELEKARLHLSVK